MVAAKESERERFRVALNARVEKDHPEERGRPQWLLDRLTQYMAKHGPKRKISVQTCAYWLAGTKIAGVPNQTLLCNALGMTRSELFGDTADPRLAAIIENWSTLPESKKTGIFALVVPDQTKKAG